MTKITNILLLLFILSISCVDNKVVIIPNSIKGSWRCEDYSPFYGNRIYMVDIERSKSDTTLYIISNFNKEGVDFFVTAHLSKNTLTIEPSQQIFGTNTIIKSGSGLVSEKFDRINLKYIQFDGKSDISIQSTYTRP